MKYYKVIIAIIAVLISSVYTLTTVYCDFEKIASTYVCSPISLNPVLNDNEEIAVNGSHLTNFKDEDVTYIRFNSPLTLQYVPTKLFEIFQNIEIFGLQNVNLVNITSEAFTNCYKLKSLHIDGNKKLTEIPARFAESCSNLVNLYLPGNAIKVIDKEAFKGLDNLHYLVLTRNELEEIDPDLLSSVGNLQNLFLDHNRIKFLNSDLFYPLRKLQLLSITNNQIEEVSLELFRNNPLLDQIFFDHNEIVAIEEKFFDEYPGRRENYEFRFYNNNCTNSIVSNKGERIENFDDFEICFKNWNESHQKVFDEEEFSTDNEVITVLNTTTEVTTTETTTTGATTTEITTTEVPSTIGDIIHRDCRYFLNENRKYTCVLENVDLALTMIGGKHYEDQNDENVTHLFFYNSTLSKVPSIIFQKFPNLEFLSIAHTQLTIINDQTFDGCGKLTKIDASGNHISKIAETSLRKCKNLKTIDVSGNPLRYIDGEIFFYDPQLKHIILNNNF
ncbi:insulin-like growth factor-binding protein complex acid labile subunit [Chironomus tepperi]|uniref:insulin-like growth factor-binding protein complex acid labile subunit n=1 Tax=Chironomus tepperi TaxID=113505 RepID=UPI00391F9A00